MVLYTYYPSSPPIVMIHRTPEWVLYMVVCAILLCTHQGASKTSAGVGWRNIIIFNEASLVGQQIILFGFG